MYRDIYFGMELTISEHPDEQYNGVYIALDNLYSDDWYSSKYIHFRNSNGMYLYYWPINEEANGHWILNGLEFQYIDLNNGGEMKYCFSYSCLYYQGIISSNI